MGPSYTTSPLCRAIRLMIEILISKLYPAPWDHEFSGYNNDVMQDFYVYHQQYFRLTVSLAERGGSGFRAQRAPYFLKCWTGSREGTLRGLKRHWGGDQQLKHQGLT